MDIAELVLKYISVILYPVLIATTIILFRKEISGILCGNFRAKYKDLELTIERDRRALETIKGAQKDAISMMRKSIDELETSEPQKPVIRNVRILIDSIEASLNDKERDVIQILREFGGKYHEQALIDYYFEHYDDPWHRSKYESDLRNAIESMVKKSVILRENDSLILHGLWIRKEK